MYAKLMGVMFSVVLVCATGAVVAAADAKPKAKVTYQEHVSAIFRNRCGSCHNGDKQKGGLNLELYGSVMQGGGSGAVIEPGNPDESTLLQLIMHKEEPKMPPNSPKIPDAEIATIRAWIEGGALEASGSVAAIKTKPKFEFKLDPSAMGKPSGEPAMPVGLTTEPSVVSPRSTAVIAMAASPWAPLVAVGGHKQVLLYRSTDNHLMGVLPFPEGTIHVLKFSRNGDLLLAGGGRGGQSGLAIVWDVKTGKRVFEIGKEYDAVLAADISPDHGQVAIGGPSKILRVYNTADGQLMYEAKKHTEWVTAIEFSPDGVLLASGDRNNGLLVWEAATGREFFDLRGHGAAITDISWRLDSNVVASSSEDGTVRIWEMENGGQIKGWGAHGGGVASVRFGKDGRLVTAGRDRVPRLWDQNGGKQRDFEPFNDLALEAVFTHDASAIVAGDWSGEVRVLDIKDGKRLANLAANPAPLAVRLDQTHQALAAAEAALKQFDAVQATPAIKASALAKAQEALNAAQQVSSQQSGRLGQAQQAHIAKSATEKIANEIAAATQTIAQKAAAEKGAADKTFADKVAAEKAATEAVKKAQDELVKAQADKAAQEKALAAAQAALQAAKDQPAKDKATAEVNKQTQSGTQLAAVVNAASAKLAGSQAGVQKASAERAAAEPITVVAAAQVNAANESLKALQETARKAIADRGAADQVLAEARTAAQNALNAANARKAEFDQAAAQKAAADAALAGSKPAIDAAVARIKALKAEASALAAEKKARDSKPAVASSAKG